MDLPNYFMADLPADTVLRPELIREAAQTLKRNRERYLLPRSTEAMVEALAEVARLWLAPHSPWLARALEHGPASVGVSRPVLETGLDRFWRQVTARNLTALVVQDLGHPQRLDRLVSNDSETFMNTQAMASGPGLVVDLAWGPLPPPVFIALIHGLLVRSAQVVCCPPEASLLPRLLAHSIRDVDPKLASTIELVTLPPEAVVLRQALFDEAEVVVAEGPEEVVASVRAEIPARTRFIPRPRRHAAAYVAREMLGAQEVARVVAAAAAEIAAWDQWGESAPEVVFVESGGMLPPEAFAERLGEELARLESECPASPRSEAVEGLLGRHREMYRVRAGSGDGSRCWFSDPGMAWSVVYDPEPQFQVGPGRRFALVKAVDDLEECLRRAEPFRGKWTTLGLAAGGLRYGELSQRFAAWGMSRICPLGRLQPVPWTSRRDGRPALGDLVQWCSVERAD